MRTVKVGQWAIAVLLGLCTFAGSVRAGGPLLFNEKDGHLFPWLDNRAVYVVEGGNLGLIPHDKAAAMVAQAFKRWTDVPTANLRVENLENILSPEVLAPFTKDIKGEDFTITACALSSPPQCPISNLPPPFAIQRIFCDVYKTCLSQCLQNCPSPIIFDEDGSFFSSVFPDNAGVIGLSGYLFESSRPDDPVEPFHAELAFSVLNGLYFDGNPQTPPPTTILGTPVPSRDDPQGNLFLDALITHELGHFLGLAHSMVNGDTALLNPAVAQVGISKIGGPGAATLSPVDALVTVDANSVETM